MRKLNENWLTESHVDFELKKYTLLAYLQEVKESYRDNKLYPWLSDLIEHYKNLYFIKENTDKMKEGFQKEVKGFDLNHWKVQYGNSPEESDLFETLQEIIEYSLPLFAENIQEGKTIYDFIEEHLHFETIGIAPLRTDEGYLLLHCEQDKNIHVYQYAVSSFELNNEKHRSISTHHVSDYTHSITGTYQKVKSDLIAKNKELPNPAVYAVNCELSIPLKETFLPVAKRYFVGKMGF